MSCVSCLLISSETLGPLFNMLTFHHMYCSHIWQKLQEQVQTQLSSIPSTFSGTFLCIFKNRPPSWLQYLRSYSFRKIKLLESHKILVSEHPLEINLLRGPKNYSRLHSSTIIVMPHSYKINWVVYDVCYSDLKS